MVSIRITAALVLLAAGTSATAAMSDTEAYGICKDGVQARYGDDANVSLRRIRTRRGITTVDVRVAGLDEGPSRLECRLGGEPELVIVDPRAPRDGGRASR